MIRHISIFFLKKDRTKEEYRAFEKALEDMEALLAPIRGYASGRDCMSRPPSGLTGVPEFGDVAQVIDFADRAAAENYAVHPAHRKLTEEYGGLIERVVAVDFETNPHDADY